MHPLIKRCVPSSTRIFFASKESRRRKRGRLLRGWGARHRKGKLVTNYWKAQEWKINGRWRWARVGPDDEYIYRRPGGRGRGARGRTRLEAGGGWGGDSVNGILLGHPFTRTRRKLEDLIWRAVWIAFALAMPPIEPSVMYVHTYTRITRISLNIQQIWARVRTCVHERAVYTKTQFVRSFVAGIFAHTEPLTQGYACYTRTCARVAFMCARSGTYVWVLTFHDLSRSFQRASKRPESAQIDKRNNRGREIEGLDLIRGESAR